MDWPPILADGLQSSSKRDNLKLRNNDHRPFPIVWWSGFRDSGSAGPTLSHRQNFGKMARYDPKRRNLKDPQFSGTAGWSHSLDDW